MLSQYLLNEWLPLNISQPTWKREGSCSYCTEEKTAAQRGWAVRPGSWPHSSHYSPAGRKEAEGPSWTRDSRQQHCGCVALSGVLADLGASRPDRGIGWDLAIRCRWRCAWRAGCPRGFSFPPPPETAPWGAWCLPVMGTLHAALCCQNREETSGQAS